MVEGLPQQETEARHHCRPVGADLPDPQPPRVRLQFFPGCLELLFD